MCAVRPSDQKGRTNQLQVVNIHVDAGISILINVAVTGLFGCHSGIVPDAASPPPLPNLGHGPL